MPLVFVIVKEMDNFPSNQCYFDFMRSEKASIAPTFYKQLFVRKSFEQLLCIYDLGLYFFGKRKLVQKLLVKLTEGGGGLKKGLKNSLILNTTEICRGCVGNFFYFHPKIFLEPLVSF